MSDIFLPVLDVSAGRRRRKQTLRDDWMKMSVTLDDKKGPSPLSEKNGKANVQSLGGTTSPTPEPEVVTSDQSVLMESSSIKEKSSTSEKNTSDIEKTGDTSPDIVGEAVLYQNSVGINSNGVIDGGVYERNGLQLQQSTSQNEEQIFRESYPSSTQTSPRNDKKAEVGIQEEDYFLADLMVKRQEREINEIESMIQGSSDIPEHVSETLYKGFVANDGASVCDEHLHYKSRTDDKFSVSRMWSLAKDYSQASKKSYDMLSLELEKLDVVKHAIAIENRKNFNYIKEIHNLENIISLLVRNRISMEDVIASTNSDISYLSRCGKIDSEEVNEFYVNLLCYMRSNPSVIAELMSNLKLVEIDSILELIMYGLYGSQYDNNEERLLSKMFESVIRLEVANEPTLSNFMRGTSALTRLMTAFTRRGSGKMYLWGVVTPVINRLIDGGVNLETDLRKIFIELMKEKEKPSSLLEEGPSTGITTLTPEEVESANNDEDCLRIRDERVELLKSYVNELLTLVSKSADEVPYVLRWICLTIRRAILEKFPDADSDQIHRCIGGIVLLRFINPSIVTPEVFNLSEEKPTPVVRKSLTLIAKVLQSLSNNVLDTRVKTSIKRDEFFEGLKSQLYQFYDEVCQVGEPEDELEVDKYILLNSGDSVTIEVSLNELYSFHNLILKYQRFLKGSLEEKFSKSLFSIIEKYPSCNKPKAVPRSQNSILTLRLYNSYLLGEIEDTDLEQKYRRVKALLTALFRRVPHNFEEDEHESFLSILQRIRDLYPELHDSVWEVMKLTSELVKEGILLDGNNFEKLRTDIVEEYEKLDELTEKVKKDFSHFAKTLENVVLHNGVLEAKLKMYDQYLRNVRESVLVKLRKETKKERKQRENEQKRLQESGYSLRFSHQHLESMGVLIETSIPPENRSLIYFQITRLNDTAGKPTENFLFVWFANGKFTPLNHLDVMFNDLKRLERESQRTFSINVAQFDLGRLINLLEEIFMRKS